MATSEKPILLDVSGLSVSFATDRGPVQAVRDVSFRVHEERYSQSSASPVPASR